MKRSRSPDCRDRIEAPACRGGERGTHRPRRLASARPLLGQPPAPCVAVSGWHRRAMDGPPPKRHTDVSPLTESLDWGARVLCVAAATPVGRWPCFGRRTGARGLGQAIAMVRCW